jgi:hypothetical protein
LIYPAEDWVRPRRTFLLYFTPLVLRVFQVYFLMDDQFPFGAWPGFGRQVVM